VPMVAMAEVGRPALPRARRQRARGGRRRALHQAGGTGPGGGPSRQRGRRHGDAFGLAPGHPSPLYSIVHCATPCLPSFKT
jgi:hypothetical protein